MEFGNEFCEFALVLDCINLVKVFLHRRESFSVQPCGIKSHLVDV